MDWKRNSKALKSRLIALAVFVAALWAIQMINWATGYGLNSTFGLIPRHIAGLDGILGMPLLHGSFTHLVSNTPPLLVMGALLAATQARALWAVNGIIVLLGGAAVWVFGAAGVHVGASGLVFGWFGFLVVRGIVDRSLATLATSAIVALVYASLIWGVLPGQEGVSWEAHLAGAVAGAIAAWAIRGGARSSRH